MNGYIINKIKECPQKEKEEKEVKLELGRVRRVHNLDQLKQD